MDVSPESDALCSFYLLLDDLYASSPTPDWLVKLEEYHISLFDGFNHGEHRVLSLPGIITPSFLETAMPCGIMTINATRKTENAGKTTMKHRHATGTASFPSRIETCELALRPISSKTSKRRLHESTSDYKYIIAYRYLIADMLPPTILKCRAVYQAKRSLGDFRFLLWRNSRRYYAYNPQRVLQPTVVADRQGRKSVPLTLVMHVTSVAPSLPAEKVESS